MYISFSKAKSLQLSKKFGHTFHLRPKKLHDVWLTLALSLSSFKDQRSEWTKWLKIIFLRAMYVYKQTGKNSIIFKFPLYVLNINLIFMFFRIKNPTQREN